ncbi:MAG: peptidylprolyl isomerase [Alphaproteobacteria bacterium]
MSHRPLRAAAVAVALALIAVPAAAQQKDQKPTAPKPATQPKRIVVAKVENEPIYQDEIVSMFRSLPPQMQSQGMPAVYPMLLEQAVNAQMLTVFGRREKLSQDPEVKERMKVAEDEIIRSVYLNRLVQQNLTEDRLKHRYDQIVKERPQEEEVRARHILVPDEAQAKSIIKELQGGADFADLATKNSRDGSARQGGDLGYFVRREMVKPFSDAAFALEKGQFTTTPVKTEFGWHIIKVEDKRTLNAPPYEQAKAQLAQDVGQQLAATIVKQLREQAKIQKFNFDGSPAAATPPAAAPAQAPKKP